MDKWLWRRKSLEKNIEKERALELERSLEELKDQLSLVRIESNAKDDLLAKQAKVSEEAIAGWRKAEAEALSLKQQLDDALLQKRSAEQRVADRDVALKECMQQLHVTKEDQQFIVNNASLKISREQEKIRTLEQRLADTNQKLTESVVEISNLNRILVVKEQMLKELCESKSNVEAKLMEEMSRLDSSEKLIASLKYELCMLQKEIEIRNQEREYSHRSANAAHRQHLESIKKIAKLETECQRLRIMVRKRLPGPTALAKMRSEVESIETRKRTSSSMGEDFRLKDTVLEDCYDLSSKGAVALVDRLRTTEDENKILKESLTNKNNELQGSRIMCARTASKLSQVEKQLEELSKRQVCPEIATGSSPAPSDLPLSSISEHGATDDAVSCVESWASALISELEHFKSGKPTLSSCRSADVSEFSLMDDTVETEKPATVSGDNNSCVTTRDSCAGLDLSEATGKEESRIRFSTFENQPNWLQDILRVILQKHHIMQKSFSAILDDVRAALCDQLNYNTEGTRLGSRSSSQQSPSNFEESVRKLVELIEGIRNGLNVPPGDGETNQADQKSPSANRYFARAYFWECAELAAVLQNFVSMCNELLYRKVDLQEFTAQVASTLDWVINHSFLLQKGAYLSSRMDDVETKLKDENEQLKHEVMSMETKRKDLEEVLKVSDAKNEKLMARLRELEGNFSNLQLKESKGHIEDQITNRKLIDDDLGTQLKEAHQQFSSLEVVQLEEKNNCCEELEATCLDLQLQTESELSKETPKYVLQQEEKLIEADCDIAAASMKLAACQETIVNLGKQLKALASPQDAPLFDKVISSPGTAKSKRRLQLVDHMRAEDQTKPESPNTKEVICTEAPKPTTTAASENHQSQKEGSVSLKCGTDAGMLMVAPKKQKGSWGGFLRKLLLQR
ncbi:filament-like plant protein 7 [Curcuma longa]|uniref:filament-like plant protein 7 n=1 Tax=Curcuma longa TaxID=136217 RepID=UPI003D9ED8A6